MGFVEGKEKERKELKAEPLDQGNKVPMESYW